MKILPGRPVPQPECANCNDWGTKVRRDGKGTEPCPEPVHQPASTTDTRKGGKKR